ncbi:hypothetical protein BDR26DRAFT_880053 [Obelidium mucronatum]|nr:hypothetical protein BDR26DRAFT_880053 [Obelidium mucronatum]
MQTESVVAAALEATAATSTEMASTPKTTTETKSTLQPLEPQNETETPKLDNSNLQTTALGVSDSESIQPTSTRTRRIQSTRPTESPKALKRLEVTTESEPWGNPTANVSSETPPPSRMASPRAAVRTMKASSTGGVNGDANGRQMDTGLSATDISQETTADKKGVALLSRTLSNMLTQL